MLPEHRRDDVPVKLIAPADLDPGADRLAVFLIGLCQN